MQYAAFRHPSRPMALGYILGDTRSVRLVGYSPEAFDLESSWTSKNWSHAAKTILLAGFDLDRPTQYEGTLDQTERFIKRRFVRNRSMVQDV